jgi:RHS repeat-associated protein
LRRLGVAARLDHGGGDHELLVQPPADQRRKRTQWRTRRSRSITGTVNGVVNPSYAYDLNGNLLTGAGRTMTYTPFNMAASIAQVSAINCLTYDTDRMRVSMDVRPANCSAGTSSIATVYLNDPVSGAMSEKLVVSPTTSWRDYVVAGGALVAVRSCTGAAPCSAGAAWTYITSDHLGSASVLTNAAATVTERDSYDAWGLRRNSNGTDNASCSITSSIDRGFTGHEMLDSLCEINANARIYDPTVGRFMRPDGMVQAPLNAQSLNRYSYVFNNPLGGTDPSGNIDSDQCNIAYCLPTDGWSTGSRIEGGNASDMLEGSNFLDLIAGGGNPGFSDGSAYGSGSVVLSVTGSELMAHSSPISCCCAIRRASST